MQFSQPSAARAINRLRILNLLASQENLSRAEAARLLKLNKVSTGEIVEALIAEGLVEETGKMVTVNGRRPTALSLKKDARAVLAVDLGTKATSVALSDLGGNLLRFERFPTPHNPKPEELCVQIIKTCLRILKMMKDPASAIGIAVSVPGSLDPSGSVVASAPVWGWKDVPLAEAISKNTGLDVVLEHNVRAMVLGERWFAASQEPSGADASMLYINWGEHISSAWVADGKVLGEGSQFGHIPLRQTGVCSCGSIGCLETVSAGWAISSMAARITGKEDITVKQACQMLDQYPDLASLLLDAARGMADALVYASAITGCGKIILGGGISSMPDQFFAQLLRRYEDAAPVRLSAVSIERTRLGDKAGLLGTAAVALDRFVFKRTMLDQLSRQK